MRALAASIYQTQQIGVSSAEARSGRGMLAEPEGESEMTLCIAAEGWIEDKQCIVFCCDTRAERGGVFHELVGSDDAWKFRTIGKNVALLSGSETPADQLLALCDKTIRGFGTQKFGDDSDLAIDQFLQDLRKHAGKRKENLVEHWVQFNLAMSFSDFRETHRGQLSSEHAKEVWSQIRDIDLEADIIVCGFQDDDPVIVRMDRYGKVFWETNYSAVGAGADIAYAFLAQHDWDDDPTLMQCAYCLLEAKTAAEQNRHVGEQTRIQILTADGKRYLMQESTFDILKEKILDRRKIPEIAFSPEMLVEDDRPEVSSPSEQDKPSTESGVPSIQQPGRPGADGAEGGDSSQRN